jgi:hypothetical protein
MRLHSRSRLLAALALCIAAAGATAAPPPKVEAVEASPKSPKSIELSWIDTSTIEQRFRVDMSAGGGPFVTVKRPKKDTEKTTVAKLTPGTFYRFLVFAENAEGTSPASAVAGAYTDLIGPPSTCSPSLDLCLLTRFRVSAEAKQGDSNVPGHGEQVRPGTGLIWFFNSDAVELLVRSLDFCQPDGHYWFFASSVTNIEYTITVTDTQAGRTRRYFNPAGRVAPAVLDTSAFATCP